MKIIVGLGNPGLRYEGTRHNLGFEAIDRLADSFKISLQQRVARSIVGTGRIASQKAVLAKPQTYMNNSGNAVLSLLSHYSEEPPQLVVICDDLDLELGRLRIKLSGGHGGNRGVDSILSSLGTNRFTRVKLGIGRPDQAAEDYVLTPFKRMERKIVNKVLEKIPEVIELLVEDQNEKAMNRFHE